MLQGNWLQELGFLVGDRVTITCQNNKLVIENAGEAAVHMVAEPGMKYGAKSRRNRSAYALYPQYSCSGREIKTKRE